MTPSILLEDDPDNLPARDERAEVPDPRLPEPCGPITDRVFALLRGTASGPWAPPPVAEPLHDRDLQLALWTLYELHYRGFTDVDPDREWDPEVLGVRALLEAPFEEAVRALADAPVAGADVTEDLLRMTAPDEPPAIARFLGRDATREQFADYLGQRAVYHLRESDPQSFLLARIDGAAKVALAELQYDEYGAGRADRLHATLFARGLAEMGMSTEPTAYLAGAEPTMLATVNAMSLFALHRRRRGAALGHLAAFEATSSIPCRLISLGAQRLGLPDAVADYYQEHVEADAVHEQLAIHSICGQLAGREPGLADDMVFGAASCLALDELTGAALQRRWSTDAGGPA